MKEFKSKSLREKLHKEATKLNKVIQEAKDKSERELVIAKNNIQRLIKCEP